MKSICRYCGKEFIQKEYSVSHNILASCCSKKCEYALYKKNKSIERICQCCGKTFTSYAALCCSVSCSKKLMWKNRKKQEKKEFKCLYCKKIFYVRLSDCRVKNNLVKFCSKKCSDLYHKKYPIKICKECGKEYRSRNKYFCCLHCKRKYKSNHLRYNHKEYMKTYLKKYYERNKDKIKANLKEKAKNDPVYNMKVRVRKLIYTAFKRKRYSKPKHMQELLGCSIEYFMEYIKSKFQEGMSYENYGEWEIDHIKPLFTAESVEDVEKLCHYSNLQPLWWEDNLKKFRSDAIKYNFSFKRHNKVQ